jgi:hypothetical protein
MRRRTRAETEGLAKSTAGFDAKPCMVSSLVAKRDASKIIALTMSAGVAQFVPEISAPAK